MHVSSLHYHCMNLFHLDHSLLDDPLPKLNALCEAVDSILQRRCFVSMIFKISLSLLLFPRVLGFDVGDLSEDGINDVEGMDASATHVANLLSTEPADSMFPQR